MWLKAISLNSNYNRHYINLINLYCNIIKDIDKAKYYASELKKKGGKLPINLQQCLK